MLKASVTFGQVLGTNFKNGSIGFGSSVTTTAGGSKGKYGTIPKKVGNSIIREKKNPYLLMLNMPPNIIAAMMNFAAPPAVMILFMVTLKIFRTAPET